MGFLGTEAPVNRSDLQSCALAGAVNAFFHDLETRRHWLDNRNHWVSI